MTSWSPYDGFSFSNVYRSEVVKLSRKRRQNFFFFPLKRLSFYFEGRKQCFPHRFTAENLMQICNQSTASLILFFLALLAKADGKCSLTKTLSSQTLFPSARTDKWSAEEQRVQRVCDPSDQFKQRNSHSGQNVTWQEIFSCTCR